MSHVKETEEKLKDVCEIKETLTDWLKEEIAKGKECVDTEETGAVVDMIKDLASVEKDCYEACYYKAVAKAMEEAKEEDEEMAKLFGRMGYIPDPQRRKPQADWRRPPYEDIPYMDEDYIDWFMDDPMNFMDTMRMGYTPKGRSSHPSRGRGSEAARSANGRYASGYSDGRDGMNRDDKDGRDRDSRYGKAYNDYQKARKYYTQSQSVEDREQMSHHAQEHVADTMTTIREIWKTADPELKKTMKSNFQSLLNEMTV